MSALLPELKHQCTGRWSSVLIALGMDQQLFNGRHQDCVVCGDQRRNARWIKEREFFICSKCGSHSAIDLAIDYLGRPFRDTAHEIRKIMGTVKMESVKTNDEQKAAENRMKVQQIIKESNQIKGDCAASRYLASRGLRVLPEQDCRFHEGLEYWQDGNMTLYPAMISIIRNNERKGAALHITYLTADGKKAPVESPKKVKFKVLDLPGCAIQLFKPVDGVLAVAEGIETALAFYQMEDVPTWAAGNANQMANMVIPDEVHTVIICPDSDKSWTGDAAANKLANRMAVKGKKVGMVRFTEEGKHYIEWRHGNYDFLDVCVRNQHQQSGRNARTLPTS